VEGEDVGNAESKAEKDAEYASPLPVNTEIPRLELLSNRHRALKFPVSTFNVRLVGLKASAREGGNAVCVALNRLAPAKEGVELSFRKLSFDEARGLDS